MKPNGKLIWIPDEQLEQAVEPVIDKANAIGKEEYELLQKVNTLLTSQKTPRKSS